MAQLGNTSVKVDTLTQQKRDEDITDDGASNDLSEEEKGFENLHR